MQIELEKTGSYSRKISVTVPPGDVDHAFDHVYKEVARGVSIPGFRPGKAPRGLIERKYASQIRDEVQNHLVSDTLFKALQDKEVQPIGMPRLVSVDEPNKSAAFSYVAEFDVQPEVTLAQYEGLEIEVSAPEVSDEDVAAELNRLREQSVQLVPLLDRDTVQEGDVVLLDYEGTMGGVPFEGGTAQNATIEVGTGGFIPGFAEGLIGAKVPGERTVAVTFPEDYGAANLAGKDASFRMTLKELKKKELPALDDDFAQDVGEESLEGLRTKMRESLEKRKEQEVKENNRKHALEALVAANPFELPPSMIEQQADRMVGDAANRMQQMMGQRLQLSQADMASLREGTLPQAEFQVRCGVLLIEVSKKAGIEVTDEELDQEIERMAEQAGEHAQRLRSVYGDPEQRDRLRYRLLDDKTVQHVLDHRKGGTPQPKKAKPSQAKARAKPEAEPAEAEPATEAKARPKKKTTKKAAAAGAEAEPVKKATKKTSKKKTADA